MTEIIKSGSGILFMKVGTHAQEPLEQIIIRKTKEIEATGFAMWGYGGNTCHPKTIVQPFAKLFEQRGQTIYLCMEEMTSKHFASPVRADQFSIEGLEWQDIHPAINVLGSRYALIIRNLRQEKLDLSLACTQVAVGNSQGRRGNRYVNGRVDKACLELTDPVDSSLPPINPPIQIRLVAELTKPYAVFLRNHSKAIMRE